MLRSYFSKPALMVLFFAFIPFGQVNTALGAENDALLKEISAGLKTANIHAAATIIGTERIDGSAFITRESRKLTAAVIFSETLKCVAISTEPDDIELSCLDGETFNGVIKSEGDVTRIAGEFQTRGDATLILKAFVQASFKDILSKASVSEYEQLSQYAYGGADAPAISTSAALSKDPNTTDPNTTDPNIAEPVAVAKSSQGVSSQTVATAIATLIGNAEELCVDLGFEQGSDKLSTCILKVLRKGQ